ncbi:hypothetical protein [Phormidium sp. CCY1219]|uniref:hypothetical protein n=1 Tax=Phormidium sp. CCY1219 TaxID=2886104 RepID=UPI002D1E9B0C|nr:hypothetical protein [Phormidium sp. CCY1219]MEB3826125.1 hypothetical protein [Phormidium sp. CCY1219]
MSFPPNLCLNDLTLGWRLIYVPDRSPQERTTQFGEMSGCVRDRLLMPKGLHR